MDAHLHPASCKRRDSVSAFLALVALLLIPYLEGNLLYGLAATEAYERLLAFPWDRSGMPRRDSLTLAGAYLSLPILGVAVRLWQSALGHRWVQRFRKPLVPAASLPKRSVAPWGSSTGTPRPDGPAALSDYGGAEFGDCKICQGAALGNWSMEPIRYIPRH